MTGSNLMAATGLSRATVISVCDELVGRGWLRELDSQRVSGGYSKGRPARRFAFDERATYLLGIDAGAAKITVIVANAVGESLASTTVEVHGAVTSAEQRAGVLRSAIADTVTCADIALADVLIASVGVAAPVSRDGDVLRTQDFWESFDVRQSLAEMFGWNVLVENDANLAALAECWRGAAAGVKDLVLLLAGERLGAGVMESARLLHGHCGGFGELGYLSHLEGVNGTIGIDPEMTSLARESITAGCRPTLLKELCGGRPEVLTSANVISAAEAGDPTSLTILDQVARRMARVIGSLSTMVNPELVVIAGGVAHATNALLATIGDELSAYTSTLPPRLAISSLGEEIVAIGAVKRALDYLEDHAIDLSLRTETI
ncbi:ROK family protein [Paenarthrobacter sp. YIM B13468]|uniref:ROK family protein n=1 Tax=Paenarthrobacter sp. YIM B13468 TaxID=3366295 RepID=UPI00366BA5B5